MQAHAADSFEDTLNQLNELQTLAENYAQEQGGDTDPVVLMLAYTRAGVYNDSLWQMTAGTKDPDFEAYVLENNSELGELVVTCLGKEALPLVRYRTGDLTRITYEPCKCGRTTCRIENISGRADDMLVIRGVNVFPTQIEEVLLKIEEIGPHYEILVERKNRLDVMTITVELIDDRLLDSYGKLSELEGRIQRALKSQLGLATQIRLVAPNSLKRFEGKAKRVTDLRKDGL